MASRLFGILSAFVAITVHFSFSIISAVADDEGNKRPNILFIPVDDLNNWVGYFSKNTPKGNAQSMTPNLDRLSAMGLSFTNAHASATICNPSRAAVWSGVRAETSGCYDNKDHPWTSFIKEGLGLNAHFKENGYMTFARGKTYHSSQQGKEKPLTCYVDEWDEYPKIKQGDVIKYITDRVGFTEPLLYDIQDDDDPDWHTVDYCHDKLMETTDDRDGKPFFLACGIVKPHMPWAVPQKYYDLYPASEVELPPYPTTNDVKDWEEAIWEDLADVPEYAINKMSNPDKEFTEVIELGVWESSIQSYLATIAYMDMNIGRLLDAFEKSPERDNTIVVLWSDHGYHLGEKGHHKKQTLWEEASDVPFIWVVPGVTTPGTICDRPVDLQSIYPTLSKLAGLDVPDHVDGDDIRPLLEDPSAEWDGVAKVTVRYKNHAIVDQRYRYIRYVDGSEELYDHDNDPNEFTNLANWRDYRDVKRRLATHLPQVDMPAWHDGEMNLNVTISCNDEDVTVKKCPGGGNFFVARDPNNYCRFLECPEYIPEPTASPTESPTQEEETDDPTESPTSSPTFDPTASPTDFNIIEDEEIMELEGVVDMTPPKDTNAGNDADKGISKLLDFTISVDIPEGSSRQLQSNERSDVALYLNNNLEDITADALEEELKRVTKSSGFPFANPSGVSLTRKRKQVYDLDAGERYEATFGGIVLFEKTSKQHFFPAMADVQDMQVEAMPRVGDDLVYVIQKEVPGSQVSSVVTEVHAESQEASTPLTMSGGGENNGDNSNTNLIIIVSCCVVAGAALVAMAAYVILTRSRRTKKDEPSTESDDYEYPPSEDEDAPEEKREQAISSKSKSRTFESED